MWNQLKGRFTPRRLALIVALGAIAFYVGWRSGGVNPPADPARCEAGRQEIKDDKGNVVQVTRTTCVDEKH